MLTWQAARFCKCWETGCIFPLNWKNRKPKMAAQWVKQKVPVRSDPRSAILHVFPGHLNHKIICAYIQYFFFLNKRCHAVFVFWVLWSASHSKCTYKNFNKLPPVWCKSRQNIVVVTVLQYSMYLPCSATAATMSHSLHLPCIIDKGWFSTHHQWSSCNCNYFNNF